MKITVFLESLNYFLKSSGKMQKIYFKIDKIPWVHAEFFANLIVEHTKLGKLVSFAGFNLKLLMENKIEHLFLKKSKGLLS